MQVLGGITIDGGVTFTRAARTQIFSTPGDYNWTAESTSAVFTVVGAGGGGAGGYAVYSNFNWNRYNGGGGAGGEVVVQTVNLTLGATYIVRVGAGGGGGTNIIGPPYVGSVGLDGEDSILFSPDIFPLITANGGYGGGRPSGDFQRGGNIGEVGNVLGSYYGGELYVTQFGQTPRAPGVPTNGFSGGGAGYGGPSGYTSNYGGGGGGGGYYFNVILQSSQSTPGNSGYVQISW